ncbi:PEP/pyruvate-binding domain-containing protein [Thermomicrobium roseum]|jgi:pyruvate,water dikinase|uniref:Phosphoenolpyruvate synthase n=1 Tax=Thermomicrobium roseum (strain ATCC 27502 / DSM 5159 / P-2) TaxID=309801 RepID=B9L4R5_THERP|nr:PEP/pyruvate-binding domain-containing protein [Thermomicrobium roseum]ACM06946.1 phosphoenolpyruvate synthase [Thermomicrobium roseum DSM 5159]
MRRSPFVRELTTLGHADRPLVGGKAASLGMLLAAGCPVPSGFALTTEAYRYFLERNGLTGLFEFVQDEEKRLDDAATQLSRRVEEAFLAAALPEDLADELAESYLELGKEIGQPEPVVAVRSSAADEDSRTASFAGQHETYLGIQGIDSLFRAVRRCWASAYTPRAIAYRVHRGLSLADASVGVVVQLLVEPRAAGVLFTLSPRTGDRSLIVIEGSWGLGQAVVAGEVTPDEYVVSKVTLELVRKQVNAKPFRYRRGGSDGSLVREELPPDLASAPCLLESEVIELARRARELEKRLGYPLDVEWAMCDQPERGTIFFLQCRPETVWTTKERPLATLAGSNPIMAIAQTLVRSPSRPGNG